MNDEQTNHADARSLSNAGLGAICDKWYARVKILRELGVESILARDNLMSCIAELREFQRMHLSTTLNGKQLKEALEFVNPDGEHNPDQLEDEVTFRYLSGTQTPLDDDTREHQPEGMYICMTDYPEEGWVGPLGVELVVPNAE